MSRLGRSFPHLPNLPDFFTRCSTFDERSPAGPALRTRARRTHRGRAAEAAHGAGGARRRGRAAEGAGPRMRGVGRHLGAPAARRAPVQSGTKFGPRDLRLLTPPTGCATLKPGIRHLGGQSRPCRHPHRGAMCAQGPNRYQGEAVCAVLPFGFKRPYRLNRHTSHPHRSVSTRLQGRARNRDEPARGAVGGCRARERQRDRAVPRGRRPYVRSRPDLPAHPACTELRSVVPCVKTPLSNRK